MNDYVILDLQWDRQTIKDEKGRVIEILRGKDYDKDWYKMGSSFAKFEKIIFQYDNPCFQKLKKHIDIETFDLVLSNENNAHYFKDKSSVYFKSYSSEYLIGGADPNTFAVIDIEKGLSKDKWHHYYFEKAIPFNFSKAKMLNDYYCIAENKVFFCFEEVFSADSKSFKSVHENVGKDKNNVYFRKEKVLGADANTFNVLDGCVGEKNYEGKDYTFYAKDKLMAYFIDTTTKIFKLIKSKSLNDLKFEVINGKGICVDKEDRYYFGKKIK